jgi:DUF438 domain-containing protein
MSELIDNRAFRIRTLKHLIQELHRGTAPDAVRARLAELVREVDASEIAAMEQELMAEGMRVEEIQSMCDLHSQVLRDFVTQPVEMPPTPGHPIDTFLRENRAVAQVVARMHEVLKELEALPDEAVPGELLGRWRSCQNELWDLEKHYRRKEHLLFSCLERHGITGPSKVMWGKDDEIRALLRGLDEALGVPQATVGELKVVARTIADPALKAISEMIFKEEKILLPMARQTLSDEEWGEIWAQSPEYGWCLVEPRQGYQPPASVAPAKTVTLPRGEAVVFPCGSLTFEQLRFLFSTLPVDLTFVDADDRVRFFSEGPRRIFERSPAILGRRVQHCHPPKSVHVVEQILADFRAGRQSVAEFWITLHGRFIHIRYFAVRDAAGEYLGTLEVTQDLTPLRALEGERRLLQYDTPTSGAAA